MKFLCENVIYKGHFISFKYNNLQNYIIYHQFYLSYTKCETNSNII